jgi:DNA-binding transcriptional ArsR family regulator
MFTYGGIPLNKNCFDTCEQLCEHPQLICLARATLPDANAILDLAETFKILGDPTRIKILHILTNNPMCVCDIAAALTMGQSAISHQLRILRTARLVKYRKEGKSVWYSLDDEHVLLLMRQGMDHIKHG